MPKRERVMLYKIVYILLNKAIIVNYFSQKGKYVIKILHKNIQTARFVKDHSSYIIEYNDRLLENSITLSLPNSQRFYKWEYQFPPFLETFLPEGYLYEIFKNLLAKEYGEVNEYLVFSLLASNIENRVLFESSAKSLEFPTLNLDELLLYDDEDTFNNLLKTFLNKNAISGVQPKTIAVVQDKESLQFKEYIVKTWGSEFAYLAENEYFCLKAVKRAGVETASVHLSKNKNFLVVEKFIYKNESELWGFEEILSLQGKTREKKYSGSYEQIAKIIYGFCTNKKESMRAFFKTIVMNYLLRNGDAHLKNFGLLFSDDFSEIKFSPAYDIVTTTAYIFRDKPALTLGGKKIWWAKSALIKFGRKHCMLSKYEAEQYYAECYEALKVSIGELEEYISQNRHFKKIGQRVLDSWRSSLDEVDIKELDSELIRSWKKS